MGDVISLCAGLNDLSSENKNEKKFLVVGYNGATIRELESIESRFITKLPQGSVVVVDQISDRRVHIIQPVNGWTSLYTTSTTPLVILQPIENE
mmetsp:Transcript_11431/g.11828  ORF Transcript_11431/g.11828 Transcript_11431/m.11828 type:complete len:94 (-) Transcript_11431:4-285(-)